jgi:hypothetical protein
MDEDQTASLIMQPGEGASGKHCSLRFFVLERCPNDRAKIERDGISRCIALWAKLYRHDVSEREPMGIHRRDLPSPRAFDW